MKIFVGSIRDHVTEEVLRETFSSYGEVQTVMHKGSYAFVFMPNNDEGRAACQALHRTDLQGCTINVEDAKPSVVGDTPVYNASVAAAAHASAGGGIIDQTEIPIQKVFKSNNKRVKFHHIAGRIKLIVGGIGNASKDQLYEHFAQYGDVHETFILEGKSVGFVHVDELKAEHMILATNEKEFNDDVVRVNYSVHKDLKRKPTRETQYVKLYIPGLADDADDQLLRQRFECFGDVRQCAIIKRSKVGFVHIDSSVAEYAMDCLRGIPFFGQPLKPQLAKGEVIPAQHQFQTNGSAYGTPPQYSHYGGGPPMHEPMSSGFNTSNGPSGFCQSMAPPINTNIYPNHHPLASLELGPGFGPNIDMKLASLPPPPVSQEELKELIERRCKLEMVHPYEKHLIESFDGNAKNVPASIPPPEYLRLLRDRSILKVRLLRAQERGFDVYGTAASLYASGTNVQDPYGFGHANSAQTNQNSAQKVATPNPATQLKSQIPNTTTANTGLLTNSQQQQNANQSPNTTINGWGNPNIPNPNGNGNSGNDSYSTAYGNSQAAGGPILYKKEFVPRRTPY